MKKKNNSQIIQISILISILLLFIIFSVTFWGINVSYRLYFATIIILFDLIILNSLLTIYIIKRKKYILFIIVFFLLLISFSLWKWIYKENKINKAHIGMSKVDAERLFWVWKRSSMSPACESCNWNYVQYYYNLWWNLWYSHIEDSYYFCYQNNIICDIERLGL